jgi:thiamine-phosphate pyrophosphorylase
MQASAILGHKILITATTTALLLLYYITDRAQFPGPERKSRERLLNKIAEAASAGVDYVQLREKDLPARELESLAQQAAQIIRDSGSSTRLLINSRTDIALVAQAHGVHLTSNDISPADAHKIWHEAQSSEPIIAVSCHSEADVIAAERAFDRATTDIRVRRAHADADRVAAAVHARPASANFVVFGPIFEKRGATRMPIGLDELRKVCQHRIPVFALGGVTTENAHLCIEAGASGVAGIRLFQENDLDEVITKLRD